jgi:hypothetical protein
MAASCGEIVREIYKYLVYFALTEASGRVFSTCSDRSDQVTHANVYVWSSRWLATFCTDDPREGRSKGVLPRVWYDYYARGSSPHLIRKIRADLLMD